MSRETKFRVWDKKNKKYRELGVYDVANGKVVVRFPIETLLKGDYILEQYTGLKDKNGKEIYEGDIVKTNSPDQPNFEVGVIEFVQQAFWISNVPSNRSDHTHSELLLQYWETEIEVIGNVHEDKGLLND